MFEKDLQYLSEAQKKYFLESLSSKSEEEWTLFFDCLKHFNVDALNKEAGNWSEPACYSAEDLNADGIACKKVGALGEKSFRDGEVAMLTVAGGLGTRLGFNGPKGLVPVTPIKHKTLFQVFAEKLISLRKRYGKPLHWLIMTSEDTDEQTRKAFAENAWYDKDYVHFFKQGTFPAFTPEGLCVLDKDGSIRYYPDGHGGVFKALQNSGYIAYLRARGIKYISYFQVDNPLVNLGDCLFLGAHLYHQSEFSTKVIAKRNPEEKVGVFVEENGHLRLVEYSELPKNLAEEKTEKCALKYRYGNTAIHLLNLDFIERCVEHRLPIHIAHKKAKHWAEGKFVENECLKLEQFIFDALVYANKALLFEVKREQEFSPVKNARGNDSLATCLKDQVARWQFWLNCVLSVDKDYRIEKNSNELIEISPLFADNFSDFLEAWKTLKHKPKTLQGLYLE